MEKRLMLGTCPICKKGEIEFIDYGDESEVMCTEHQCDFYYYRDAPLIHGEVSPLLSLEKGYKSVGEK